MSFLPAQNATAVCS